ncbi:MAG TPA: DUF1223 domain-containing protein [Hyphomicrobiaceae bacterium]|nr:DUF1223 domain-containing protein [Hyphomicrobiaceae bacterium]
MTQLWALHRTGSLSLMFAGMASLLAVALARAEAPASPRVAIASVVELFTSQGCPKCPPADALLKTYADRPGVLAVTYHVDYWDYLGWRDTFASAFFTERQRGYAAIQGDGMIYTPQVVINGRAHTTGSKAPKIDAAITATTRAFADARISVDLVHRSKMIVVKVGARTATAAPQPDTAKGVDMATVWLLAIQKSATVKIGHGDNSGRTAVYTNVVRRMVPVGSWTGATLEVKLDSDAVKIPGVDACAILVQSGVTGPLLGATPIIDL